MTTKHTWLISAAVAALLMAGAANAQSQHKSHGAAAQAAPSHSSQAAPAGAADQAESTAPQATTNNKASTSGQSNSSTESTPNKTSGKSSMQSEGKSSESTKSPAAANGSNAKQAGSSSKSSARATSGSTSSAEVNLTVQQKKEVKKTVIKSGPKVTNVNFNVSIGTSVPHSVRVAPVPQVLIEIHPAWRGYRYFVYNDEVIIVEPHSLRIVAIVPV